MASATESEDHDGVSNDLNKPLKQGWLMKRTRLSHSWKNNWCYLLKTELFYSETVEGPSKGIDLEGCEMLDCAVDKKAFAWGIKPQGKKELFISMLRVNKNNKTGYKLSALPKHQGIMERMLHRLVLCSEQVMV